jgi:hypothetical protein
MDSKLDTGDNFAGRASTIWPRASFWQLAVQVGCRYFVQLDDDYTDFQYYFDSTGNFKYQMLHRTCDDMFSALLDFYLSTTAVTVAMSQGGDFIGGAQDCRLRRKAMNVFFCSTDRPFQMFGRRNEDVNAYVVGSRMGILFFTVLQAKITQIQSQTNPGLITQAYLESGTYVKSFYTVMYAPSCVKIGLMGDNRVSERRIHHKINWNNCAPKILRDEHKKPCLTSHKPAR